jgi:hypothetical protein
VETTESLTPGEQALQVRARPPEPLDDSARGVARDGHHLEPVVVDDAADDRGGRPYELAHGLCDPYDVVDELVVGR